MNFNRITQVQGIVLAAGTSSRFNNGSTKLLAKICGQEMILYPTRLLHTLGIPLTIVVGFAKESIQERLVNSFGDMLNFVVQEQQRGTGHAIACSKQWWSEETILIMNGDAPLVTHEIITKLYQAHRSNNAAISFVTAHNADPSLEGYGRVMQEHNHIAIVEARDFHADVHQHCCVNAGIYLVQRTILEETISQLTTNNASGEFYFTDIIALASKLGHTVITVEAPFDHIRGINTLHELWIAEQLKRAELIKYWMEQGVHFSAPHQVHIDLPVTIGKGSRIGCGVHLLGATSVGAGCTIDEFSIVEHSTLADHCHIKSHSIVKHSQLDAHTHIGPFAHIHTASSIGAHAVIGNFVEVKNCSLQERSKAKHLTYLGDAQIGTQVNIGAGTITCNHDGTKKHVTHIQDNAYIGSNTTLIAPLTVGAGAFTAAGSVITEDVPAHALAIGRSRQVNKADYATKLRPNSTAMPPMPENSHNNQQSS